MLSKVPSGASGFIYAYSIQNCHGNNLDYCGAAAHRNDGHGETRLAVVRKKNFASK
jgi:hypothetical protein